MIHLHELAQLAIDWRSLNLDPVLVSFGPIAIRWYSLAYIAGVIGGWWYQLKLASMPGSPWAKRHVDDFVAWVIVAIILGGRLAYVIFYEPRQFIQDPMAIVRLWEGGMSFHGGAIGVSIAIILYSWKHRLDWLRVHDYVACVVPIGLGLGRVANFINGELWGRPTDLPWGVIFPGAGPVPRHPSQLYEAILEGPVLFFILWYLFFKTDARYHPGRLVGTFILGYGAFRFMVEFVREPDVQLGILAWGLTMGQTLTVPMILVGLFLIVTSAGRRERLAEANRK